jgi:hypothetical protein
MEWAGQKPYFNVAQPLRDKWSYAFDTCSKSLTEAGVALQEGYYGNAALHATGVTASLSQMADAAYHHSSNAQTLMFLDNDPAHTSVFDPKHFQAFLETGLPVIMLADSGLRFCGTNPQSINAFQKRFGLPSLTPKPLSWVSQGLPRGYTLQEWSNRLTVTNKYKIYKCNHCADDMAKSFPNAGDSYITLRNTPPGQPLLGPRGNDIGAPVGWHIVTKDRLGNIWDNFGFQGASDTYLAGVSAANSQSAVAGEYGSFADAMYDIWLYWRYGIVN